MIVWFCIRKIILELINLVFMLFGKECKTKQIPANMKNIMGVFNLTKRKFGLGLSLVLAAGTILGACGANDEEATTQKIHEGTGSEGQQKQLIFLLQW